MTTSLYTTIIDSSAPTTSTTGVVGQWYIDTSTTIPTLYLCTAASGGTYTWTEMSYKDYVDQAIAASIGNVSQLLGNTEDL